MADQFVKAAAISTKSAVQMMKLTKRQLEVTMLCLRVVRERLENWTLRVGKNKGIELHY